ncbi:hypothetical protein [Sediminibacterium sp.]|uniref:hypothetical protein n=1 Tax=Sediminibacterium sp. TaxID=1917865 RepID=UPI003F6A3116
MVCAATQMGFLQDMSAPWQKGAALGWRAHFAIWVPVNHPLFFHPEIAFSQLQNGSKTDDVSMTSVETHCSLALYRKE